MNGSLRLAVTGRPIIHSKSPCIFSSIFENESVSGFYSRIAADTIDEAVKCAENIKISGMNVTSPFKEDALKISENVNSTAEILDASNTLTLSNSIVSAANTDPEGVSAAVLKKFPAPGGCKAVVIGAGGAGAAAAYALSKIGFKTVMINRTVEKAEIKTSCIKNCSADSLDNINNAVKDASLIVHTLPVSEYFFDIEYLSDNAVLFDANYKYSPLKKAAEAKGLDYIDGRQWLLGQAEAAYKIFVNKAGCPEMRKKAENYIPGKLDQTLVFSTALNFKNISLIGFMGSGKSASGRALADLTGYEFIDTDSVIEKKAGITIKEMFKEKGEPYFRKLERDVFEELLNSSSRKIISCGGGAVGDSRIRTLLKAHSLPVWLTASVKVSLERIKDNNRPLLDNDEKRRNAVKLFNERIDLYGSVSELIVNTENRDAEKTAGRIYEEISEFL